MAPNLSLQRVAAQLPFTYTGADFYALCSDAMLKAVTRQASAVDAKIADINRKNDDPISTAYFFDHYATKEDIAVLVTEEDFISAQRELIPSVSAKELEHYKRVREQFESVGEKEMSKNGNGEENGNGKENGNGIAKKGVPEWQTALRPKTNGRVRSKGKDKGKGKARADIDDIDEEDEEMMGMNGHSHGLEVKEWNGGIGNGNGNAFQDIDAGDDEGLY